MVPDMSYFGTTDNSLEIGRGNVSGQSLLLKFGRNGDVDTGGYEDVWDGGGTWVPPTAARVHNIVSSSVNDTAAGTGARTVTIIGLNGSYAVTTETVTLNGTTNVTTANSYTIIYRMYVVTAGSGGTNAGNITATAQTDATVTAQISIGVAQTLMAIYQVPAGKTAYLRRYYASLNNATSATSADVRLLVKPFGEVYQTKHVVGLLSTGSSFVDYRYDLPLVITEKSLIKLSAETSANNMDVSGGFDLVLI
jgi:hypothetical protein